MPTVIALQLLGIVFGVGLIFIWWGLSGMWRDRR